MCNFIDFLKTYTSTLTAYFSAYKNVSEPLKGSMIIYCQWTFQKYPWFFDMSKKVRENLKNIFLANLCKIVDIQVPLWSHFLNLIIYSYFVTKCFFEAYILILQPKRSSGDPWNLSLEVFVALEKRLQRYTIFMKI